MNLWDGTLKNTLLPFAHALAAGLERGDGFARNCLTAADGPLALERGGLDAHRVGIHAEMSGDRGHHLALALTQAHDVAQHGAIDIDDLVARAPHQSRHAGEKIAPRRVF